MNLINIIITNFKQFFKISLLMIISLILSLYLILNYYKNSYIKIKTFDLVMMGNFTSAVFNKISQPIFQNYQSKKVYLKKNSTNKENSRIYTLLYLDNKENEKFIKNWKLNLEIYFLEMKKAAIEREFEIKFPRDNTNISYRSKNISINQSLNETLKKKRGLDDKNILKKNILKRKSYLIIKEEIIRIINKSNEINEDNKKKFNKIVQNDIKLEKVIESIGAVVYYKNENKEIDINEIINDNTNFSNIFNEAKKKINNKTVEENEAKKKIDNKTVEENEDKKLKFSKSLLINQFILENKNEIVRIIASSKTINSAKKTLITKKWINSKFLKLKRKNENKKNSLNLLTESEVEEILSLKIYNLIGLGKSTEEIRDLKTTDTENKKIVDLKTTDTENKKIVDLKTTDTENKKIVDIKTTDTENKKIVEIKTTEAESNEELKKIREEINKLDSINRVIKKDIQKITDFQKSNIFVKEKYFSGEIQNNENKKYLSVVAMFILLLSYLILNLYLFTIPRKS